MNFGTQRRGITGMRVLQKKGKGRPYSITERRVPELIPVLGSQPAGDVSHKPSGRLPLLSARPAVTLTHLAAAGGQRCFCDPIRKIDADSFFTRATLC